MINSKRLSLLWIVLLVQLLLVLLVWWPRQHGPVTGQPLLGIDTSAVTQVLLDHTQDGKPVSLTLTRTSAGWQLPSESDFPADASRVTELLGKLSALKTSLPVAVTETAAKRFHVAKDAFATRVTLTTGSHKTVLYVGDAAGANLVYVRMADSHNIYALALPDWLLATDAASWQNSNALFVDASHMTSLTLPNVALVKKGSDWQLAKGGAALDQGKTLALVNQLADAGFLSVAGNKDKLTLPSGGFDATVMVSGKSLAYHLVEVPAASKTAAPTWWLTRSDQPFVFVVTADLATSLQSATPATLAPTPVKPKTGAVKPTGAAKTTARFTKPAA